MCESGRKPDNPEETPACKIDFMANTINITKLLLFLSDYHKTLACEIPHACEWNKRLLIAQLKSQAEAAFIFFLPQKHSHPPTDYLKGSTYLINPQRFLETSAVTFSKCVNINQNLREPRFKEALSEMRTAQCEIVNSEAADFQVSLSLSL